QRQAQRRREQRAADQQRLAQQLHQQPQQHVLDRQQNNRPFLVRHQQIPIEQQFEQLRQRRLA
ncbi:unnamed protein product, partial [Rotaria magnacalcarata]